MAQKRALATSAAAHNDEDVAALDHEVEIAHQDETAVGHRQVAHDDVRRSSRAIVAVTRSHFSFYAQIPRKLKTTANMPEATTIMTIAITTACVAASPTAEELLPHWKPRRQPAIAISTP